MRKCLQSELRKAETTMKINKLDDGIRDLENDIANLEDEIRDLLQQE